VKVLSPTLALSLLLVPAALAGGANSARPAECRDAVSGRDAHRVAATAPPFAAPRIEAAAARQIRVIGTAPAVAPRPPPVSPTGRPGGYAPTSAGSLSLGRDN